MHRSELSLLYRVITLLLHVLTKHTKGILFPYKISKFSYKCIPYYHFFNRYILFRLEPNTSISFISQRITLVLAKLKPSNSAISFVFAVSCFCKCNLIFSIFLSVLFACFLSLVFYRLFFIACFYRLFFYKFQY